MFKSKWIGALALVAVAGCGGGGGGSSSGLGTGTGTMAVRMADSPDPTITEVDVTIDRVQAHVGSQWVDITNDSQTVNLVDLIKNDALLGTAPVPAGHYTQIRLYPSSVTVVDAYGTHDVSVGSAKNTGIKVNVDADVQADTATTLLLDFNVDESLIKEGNGQYRLKPVIRGVVQTLSGTVTGVVADAGGLLTNAKITAVYESGPYFPGGTEIATTSSLVDGTFKFWGLLPGTYTLELTWTNEDATVTETATLNDVVVNADEETATGTITLS